MKACHQPILVALFCPELIPKWQALDGMMLGRSRIA